MARASLKNQQAMLENLNKSILKMSENFDKFIELQTKSTKATRANTESLKKNADAILEEGQAYTRRGAILKAVADQNNNVVNLGINTLRQYRKAGGTTLEYFAAFLSGSGEQLRVLNVEVASVRRIFFGFFRGSFTFFNKAATFMNGIGSTLRLVRKETDATTKAGKRSGGVFKTLFSDFDRATSQIKAAQTAQETFYRRSVTAQTKVLGIGLPPDAAERQLIGRKQAERTLRSKRMRMGANIATLGAFDNLSGRAAGFTEPLEKMLKGFFGVVKVIFTKATADLLVKGFKGLFIGATKFFILFFRFTLMATLVMTGIFVIVMALKEPLKMAFEVIQQAIIPTLTIIANGFMTVWEGIQEIYRGFVEGDLFAVIGGVWTIAWGLLQIAFGVITTLVTGVLAFIVGFLKAAINSFVTYIFDFSGGLRKQLGKIVIIGGLILGLIFGFPAVLALAVVTSIGVLLSKLNPFGRAIGGVVAAGETTLVGERGPELVKLPTGSRVMTNNQSKRIGGNTTINVTINARDTSDNEMRRIADKIGRMINNKINRNVGASSLR